MKSNSVFVKEERLVFNSQSESGPDSEPVQLLVRKSARRQNGFKLSVLPDLTVRIDAPLRTSRVQIGGIVAQRLDWIRVQLRRLAEKPAIPQLLYQDGEQHLFLGQFYPIQINPDQSETKLENGLIKIRPGRAWQSADQAGQAVAVKKALQKWYDGQAMALISAWLTEQVGRVDWLEQVPEFRLRLMRGRWGSCSRKGGLLFNRHLIKAPQQGVEYVLAHELCHLREFNHSQAFYQLLAELEPDWRARRVLLDEQAALIMNA